MNIIFSFLPWLVQGALSSISLPLALGISFLLACWGLKRDSYVIEWTAFCFFLASFITSLFIEGIFFQNALAVLPSVILSVVAWGSLWLAKPFTLHYARSRTPEKAWNTPLFLRVNTLMTIFFGVIFSFELVIKTIRLAYPDLLPYSLFSYAISGSIMVFVPCFPKWYKARAIKRGDIV
jgi:hypothetical protein